MGIPPADVLPIEEAHLPLRPTSRASKVSSGHDTLDTVTQRSITPRPTSPVSRVTSPVPVGRSNSQQSAERRPMGPRAPSPLPLGGRSHPTRAITPQVSPLDDEMLVKDPPLHRISYMPNRTGIPTAIPRSRRQPLFPVNMADATPKPQPQPLAVQDTGSSVEPLSIKKKTPSHTSVAGTPSPTRKPHMAPSSSPFKRASPRRVSPQVRSMKLASGAHHLHFNHESLEQTIQLAKTTKEDVRYLRLSR